MTAKSGKAVVIGSGPNGLSAAIVLAQAGLQVEVYEAEQQPGGAARTMELTLPGFYHDFGSAVHPMAAASPFFSSLPLEYYGLEFIHSPVPLAHPFDDGSVITLEHNLDAATEALAEDGKAWRELVRPMVEHWPEFAHSILHPLLRPPRHPLQMARFGLSALMPASMLARSMFRSERTRALFAGMAAHSFLALDEPASASFGVVLGALTHIVGWPIARGGSQSITRALMARLNQLGGIVKTSNRVDSLDGSPSTPTEVAPGTPGGVGLDLADCDLVLCDLVPRQLLRIAGDRFTPSYRSALARYRHGPGAFKVDYALSQPIPWRAADCARAATVHLGGSLEEIELSEDAMRNGRYSEWPFVLLSQPTLFDPSRAPEGRHIAWAYCHVPNGSTVDMLPRLEAQIERFAPGFRDCVLARRILRPAELESMDANLVGGDIVGGAAELRQLVFRPTWRQYATSDRRIYLCSSSTPPGGGVHGMCGYNAARLALHRLGFEGSS